MFVGVPGLGLRLRQRKQIANRSAPVVITLKSIDFVKAKLVSLL